MRNAILIVLLVFVIYLLFIKPEDGNNNIDYNNTTEALSVLEIQSTVESMFFSAQTREAVPVSTIIPIMTPVYENLVPTAVITSQDNNISPTQLQALVDNVITTRAIYMECVAKETVNSSSNGVMFNGENCAVQKKMFDNAEQLLEIGKQHHANN